MHENDPHDRFEFVVAGEACLAHVVPLGWDTALCAEDVTGGIPVTAWQPCPACGDVATRWSRNRHETLFEQDSTSPVSTPIQGAHHTTDGGGPESKDQMQLELNDEEARNLLALVRRERPSAASTAERVAIKMAGNPVMVEGAKSYADTLIMIETTLTEHHERTPELIG